MRNFLALLLVTSCAVHAAQNQFLEEEPFKKVMQFYLEDHLTGYTIQGVNIYVEKEKYSLRIDIKNNGITELSQVSNIFASISRVSQFSIKPIHEYVVIIHNSQGKSKPAIYSAEASCSQDCFLNKTMSVSDWLGTCLISRMNL